MLAIYHEFGEMKSGKKPFIVTTTPFVQLEEYSEEEEDLNYSKYYEHATEITLKSIDDTTKCDTAKEPIKMTSLLEPGVRVPIPKGPPFICEICGHNSATKSLLASHRHRKHRHKPDIFECEKCQLKFNTKHQYDKHIKRPSCERYPKYTCEVCSKDITGFANYNIHMRFHNKEYPFVCHECGKGFMLAIHLKTHIQTKHENKRFICEVAGCGKLFQSQSSLKTHMYVHMDTMPYRCEYCNKMYPNKARLRWHIQKLHNVQLTLPELDQSNKKREAVKIKKKDQSVEIKEEIRAEDDIFKNTNQNNVQNLQNKDIEEIRIENEFARYHATTQEFVCKICNESWETQTLLDEHGQEKHEILRDIISEPPILIKEEVVEEELPNLQVRSTTPNDILLHNKVLEDLENVDATTMENERQSLTTDAPFNCKLCGHISTTKNSCQHTLLEQRNVEPEVNVRFGKGPIILCDICGLSLPSQNSLKMHNFQKHPELEKNSIKLTLWKGKSFVCDLCGQKFSSENDFSQHYALNHNLATNTFGDIFDFVNEAQTFKETIQEELLKEMTTNEMANNQTLTVPIIPLRDDDLKTIRENSLCPLPLQKVKHNLKVKTFEENEDFFDASQTQEELFKEINIQNVKTSAKPKTPSKQKQLPSDSSIFICEDCGYGSAKKNSLIQHRLRKHRRQSAKQIRQALPDGPPFICEECGYRGANKSSFTQHRFRKHRRQPAEHNLELKNFEDNEDALQTQEELLEEIIVKNDKTLMKPKTPSKLKQTLPVGPPFICKDCGHKTYNKNSLTQHRLRKHCQQPAKQNLKLKTFEKNKDESEIFENPNQEELLKEMKIQNEQTLTISNTPAKLKQPLPDGSPFIYEDCDQRRANENSLTQFCGQSANHNLDVKTFQENKDKSQTFKDSTQEDECKTFEDTLQDLLEEMITQNEETLTIPKTPAKLKPTLSDDPPFMCEECGHRTVSKNSLYQHRLRHRLLVENNLETKSIKENEDFLNENQTVKQQLLEEINIKNIVNNEDQTLTIPITSSKQNQPLPTDFPFQCNSCDYKAASENILAQHFLKKHSQIDKKRQELIDKGKINCELCNFFTYAKRGLIQHYRVKHNKSFPKSLQDVLGFSCNLCDYSSTTITALRQHKHRNHRQEIKGRSRYSTKTKTSNTEFEQIEIDNNQCQTESSNSEMSTDNSQALANSNPESSPSPPNIKCEFCDFKTTTNNELQKHYRLQHKENMATIIKRLPAPKSVLEFKCNLCDYRSGSRQLLNSHRYAKHREYVPKKRHYAPKDGSGFRCNNCDYRSATIVAMRQHKFRKHREKVKRTIRYTDETPDMDVSSSESDTTKLSVSTSTKTSNLTPPLLSPLPKIPNSNDDSLQLDIRLPILKGPPDETSKTDINTLESDTTKPSVSTSRTRSTTKPLYTSTTTSTLTPPPLLPLPKIPYSNDDSLQLDIRLPILKGPPDETSKTDINASDADTTKPSVSTSRTRSTTKPSYTSTTTSTLTPPPLLPLPKIRYIRLPILKGPTDETSKTDMNTSEADTTKPLVSTIRTRSTTKPSVSTSTTTSTLTPPPLSPLPKIPNSNDDSLQLDIGLPILKGPPDKTLKTNKNTSRTDTTKPLVSTSRTRSTTKPSVSTTTTKSTLKSPSPLPKIPNLNDDSLQLDIRLPILKGPPDETSKTDKNTSVIDATKPSVSTSRTGSNLTPPPPSPSPTLPSPPLTSPPLTSPPSPSPSPLPKNPNLNNRRLKRGILKGPPFICELCEYKTNFKTCLYSHRYSRHREKPKHEKTHEKPYECLYCEHRERHKKPLYQHCHLKHQHEHSVSPNTLPYKTAYKCNICDYYLPSKPSLYHHKFEKHRDNKTAYPLRCPQCSKGFQKMEMLKIHIKKQHPNTNFNCEHPNCGQEHATEEALKDHMRREHTHLMPYRCGYCLEMFATKPRLQIHFQKAHDVIVTLEELDRMFVEEEITLQTETENLVEMNLAKETPI